MKIVLVPRQPSAHGEVEEIMAYVGVNIGALTVKVAILPGDARSTIVLAHQGRLRGL